MQRYLFFPLLAAVLLLAAPPGNAAMPGDEFDAMTRGKTLLYTLDGVFHGLERHLGNRRVEWTFGDGICYAGYWYETGDDICFVYEGIEGAQCWRFEDRPGGLTATFVEDGVLGRSYEASPTTAQVSCEGPEVGV